LLRSSVTSTAANVIVRHGAVVAAVVASLAALPCLGLPVLSDDWANLAAVENGIAAATPFRYFRPLYLASYWSENLVWGLSPSLSHLTNLLLIATASGLVVMLTRRYTHDAKTAGLAGILFAVHPYHIENVAWIAGRSDSLCAVFVLMGALFYDRWRETCRGLPIATAACFEAALLAKESAIVLPALLILVGLCDQRRRAGVREWNRGLIPMIAVALVHFFYLRPPGLTGPGIDVWGAMGPAGLKRLGDYFTAALLPAQAEIIESHPRVWFGVAVVAGLTIAVFARRASSRIPALAWAAGAAFMVLLGPAVAISFQQRYDLLPSAAAAVALAALLLSMRVRAAVVLGTLLMSGWLVALGHQWTAWRDAGIASKTLIAGLVNASLRPNIREIVVVNAPNRIHGQPVAGDWASAVRLSGGRRVKVFTAPSLDYPVARERILSGLRASAVRLPPPYADITSVIPSRRYFRYVAPQIPVGSDRVERDFGTIELGPGGALQVRIFPAADGSRTALLWSEGRLETLF
jgi:hypothetical protein